MITTSEILTAAEAQTGLNATLEPAVAEALGILIDSLNNEASLTAAAESAINAFLAINPKGKFGKHEYNIEDYGLTEAEVRERFSGYFERFNIPRKH